MGRKPANWDTDNLGIPENAEVLGFDEIVELADQLPCPECKQPLDSTEEMLRNGSDS